MGRVFDILIVGGGQAGRRAAEGSRAASPEASIAIAGEEPHLPYDRPPLSKEALRDFSCVGRTEIRSAQWYAESRIEIMLDQRIVAIDTDRRLATSAGGETIEWRSLVLATGSRPRRLDLGIDVDRVHTIRTRDDAERLSARLLPGRRIGIVGAGFIGLEAAATARMRGCAVEVFEAAPHAMARVLPEFVARVVEGRHAEASVGLHFEAQADAVVLACFDEIVVGVGVVPNQELGERCGIACADGILIDAFGRTSHPAVFAAGEVTRHPSWRGEGLARRESWQVAEHQAFAAGSTAAGVPIRYNELPWFWSDQHDMNIQVLGDLPADAEWVLRGDLGSRAFSAFALAGEGIAGVVAVNMGRDIAAGRRLIARGIVPAAAQLGNTSVAWNEMLKSAA